MRFVQHNSQQTGFAMIDEGFMQIRQALGTTLGRAPATVRFLADFVEDLRVSGLIGDALRRSGQDSDLVA